MGLDRIFYCVFYDGVFRKQTEGDAMTIVAVFRQIVFDLKTDAVLLKPKKEKTRRERFAKKLTSFRDSVSGCIG